MSFPLLLFYNTGLTAWLRRADSCYNYYKHQTLRCCKRATLRITQNSRLRKTTLAVTIPYKVNLSKKGQIMARNTKAKRELFAKLDAQAEARDRKVKAKTVKFAAALAKAYKLRAETYTMRLAYIDCIVLTGAKRQIRIMVNYLTKQVTVRLPDSKLNIVADNAAHLQRIVKNVLTPAANDSNADAEEKAA
ncbi:hypothetical protein [Burkholderia phage BCSR5]|nr:hypothetical protein [Burkholderia phage BCSR5]